MEDRSIWIPLEGADKAQMMKRLVIKAIIKMCARSILLAAIVGVIIGIVGYTSKWNSPIAYSNAFFLAACLVIAGGVFSRFAVRSESDYRQLLNAESFRGMSGTERANLIIEATSSVRHVILGVLTGMWLVLISAIAAYVW